MLSPSARQVTHALLTRPPLKQESLGFIPFPFDLHVLGTPPAFILSQDQTLMLKAVPGQLLSGILFLVCSSEINFAASFSDPLKEFSGLHCCLFIKVQEVNAFGINFG